MESAESVAANLGRRRNVTIEILNLTSEYCLVNPKVHKESGKVHVPPTPVVIPLKPELINFSKTAGASSGAVGVLTYDLLQRGQSNSSEVLALMFSIPYDYNIYQNWFAVGIFHKGLAVDHDLFEKMYREEGPFVREKANGSCITYYGQSVDIKATMSPMGRAIMKVEIWNKLLKPK